MNSMQETVHALFLTGKIDGFLGYRKTGGHLLPYLFSGENPEELAGFISHDPVPRYPLPKILVEISRVHPGVRLGLLARECDRRALSELVKLNQIDPEKLLILPLACCPSGLEEPAQCSYLRSPAEKGEGPSFSPGKIGPDPPGACLEGLDLEDRFRRWKEEFAKCIKCFGCRNVCPVYVCKECSLEDEALIPAGQIPPDFTFHLVRAVHLAGLCIDCGLCEEACPAEIPLRRFYRGGNQIVEKLFGYKPGKEGERSPFHRTGPGEKGTLP
jgi:formate dehydrogenase (coenzyme F420) beta subunit